MLPSKSGFWTRVALIGSVVSGIMTIVWLTLIISGSMPTTVTTIVVAIYFAIVTGSLSVGGSRGKRMMVPSWFPLPAIIAFAVREARVDKTAQVAAISSLVVTLGLIVVGMMVERRNLHVRGE